MLLKRGRQRTSLSSATMQGKLHHEMLQYCGGRFECIMNAHTYVASELRRGYAVYVSVCTCASIAVVL